MNNCHDVPWLNNCSYRCANRVSAGESSEEAQASSRALQRVVKKLMAVAALGRRAHGSASQEGSDQSGAASALAQASHRLRGLDCATSEISSSPHVDAELLFGGSRLPLISVSAGAECFEEQACGDGAMFEWRFEVKAASGLFHFIFPEPGLNVVNAYLPICRVRT